MATATCRDCNETKPSAEFFGRELVRKRCKPCCKSCIRKKQNAWRAANPDKVKAYGRTWYANNKAQAAAAQKSWEQRNRAKRTERLREMRATGWKVNYDLVTRYGITVDQYQAMLNAQSGLCACCGAPGLTGRQRLFVDHCHRTGRVRGLICRNCNTGIGQLGDSVEGLRRAVAYLQGGLAVVVDGHSLMVPGSGEGLLH